MAGVSLTRNLLYRMLMKTEEITRSSLPPVHDLPTKATEDIGEELFSLLLPDEHEKQIRALAPDWIFKEHGGLYVSVRRNQNTISTPYQSTSSTSWVFAPYKRNHMAIYGSGVIRNVQGIDNISWNADRASIELGADSDIAAIQQPSIRKFVEEVMDYGKQLKEMTDAVNSAREDMSTFLGQFRTLNKAVDKFGPALLEYVPEEYKAALLRPPVKRAPRAKRTPVDVDLESLIARATEHRLQLN